MFLADGQHEDNFFIRISINNIVKCTKLCSLLPQNIPFIINERKTVIKFDEVKYFSVQVMLTFSSRYKNAIISNVLH